MAARRPMGNAKLKASAISRLDRDDDNDDFDDYDNSDDDADYVPEEEETIIEDEEVLAVAEVGVVAAAVDEVGIVAAAGDKVGVANAADDEVEGEEIRVLEVLDVDQGLNTEQVQTIKDSSTSGAKKNISLMRTLSATSVLCRMYSVRRERPIL